MTSAPAGSQVTKGYSTPSWQKQALYAAAPSGAPLDVWVNGSVVTDEHTGRYRIRVPARVPGVYSVAVGVARGGCDYRQWVKEVEAGAVLSGACQLDVVGTRDVHVLPGNVSAASTFTTQVAWRSPPSLFHRPCLNDPLIRVRVSEAYCCLVRAVHPFRGLSCMLRVHRTRPPHALRLDAARNCRRRTHPQVRARAKGCTGC